VRSEVHGLEMGVRSLQGVRGKMEIMSSSSTRSRRTRAGRVEHEAGHRRRCLGTGLEKDGRREADSG
jgi:hypothetical protein